MILVIIYSKLLILAVRQKDTKSYRPPLPFWWERYGRRKGFCTTKRSTNQIPNCCSPRPTKKGRKEERAHDSVRGIRQQRHSEARRGRCESSLHWQNWMCAAACRCPAQHTPPITSKHLNYFKTSERSERLTFFLRSLRWVGEAPQYCTGDSLVSYA